MTPVAKEIIKLLSTKLWERWGFLLKGFVDLKNHKCVDQTLRLLGFDKMERAAVTYQLLLEYNQELNGR